MIKYVAILFLWTTATLALTYDDIKEALPPIPAKKVTPSELEQIKANATKQSNPLSAIFRLHMVYTWYPTLSTRKQKKLPNFLQEVISDINNRLLEAGALYKIEIKKQLEVHPVYMKKMKQLKQLDSLYKEKKYTEALPVVNALLESYEIKSSIQLAYSNRNPHMEVMELIHKEQLEAYVIIDEMQLLMKKAKIEAEIQKLEADK